MDTDDIIIAKGEEAEKNFRSGLGCCQSVLLAFKDELGMDEGTLKRLGAPFGGGIARMRHVCGAAMALFMLSGLLKSNGDRAEDYARTRLLADEYASENGSVICAELLKGIPTTDGTTPEARDEGYYKRRPCASLCASAARIAAKHLLDGKSEPDA